MFPALRIGFVVLPRGIAAHTAVALQEMLRGGHRLEQLALAHFIESGEFGRHLGRMRRLYRERQQALREALAGQFAAGADSGRQLRHASDAAVAAAYSTIAPSSSARSQQAAQSARAVRFRIAAARRRQRAGDRLRQYAGRATGACCRLRWRGAGMASKAATASRRAKQVEADRPARQTPCKFLRLSARPMSRYRVVYARRFGVRDVDESPAGHAERTALHIAHETRWRG